MTKAGTGGNQPEDRYPLNIFLSKGDHDRTVTSGDQLEDGDAADLFDLDRNHQVNLGDQDDWVPPVLDETLLRDLKVPVTDGDVDYFLQRAMTGDPEDVIAELRAFNERVLKQTAGAITAAEIRLGYRPPST